MTDEAEWLAQAASKVAPIEKPGQPSPLRIYMREHFETLMRVKAERGLSWPQMATILSERGLAKADGSSLDGNAVAVMAAHIRTERGPKPAPKRRGRPRQRRERGTEPPAPHRQASVADAVAAPEPARPASAPAPSTPQEASSAPKPLAMPVADPEVARRLNNLRTIEEVPPMALPAGWRKRKGNDDG